MISIIRYSDSLESIWNAFIGESKKPLFMFNRLYMDYHKDRFIDHSLLFYKDNKLFACLPACECGSVLVSHAGLTYGGMITNSEMKQSLMNECFDALINYGREINFERIVFKLVPFCFYLQSSDEEKYSLYINGARLVKIEASTIINFDYPFDVSKLRKRMIKKAIQNDVIISEDNTKQNYILFINLLNEVLLKRHGVRAVHTFDELFLLHSRFTNNIKLFSAWKNNEMIAGAVIYIYENTIHTQYLAADDEARKIGALDLVISYIIEKFKNIKGFLDFGISTEENGMFLNEGLISQKEGFGGRSMTYETWEMPFSSVN